MGTECLFDTQVVDAAINVANRSGRALFLIMLATKPCYIKLASVVLACRDLRVPFLAVDVGQHYEPELVSAMEEFGYADAIGIRFTMRGDLLERTALLSRLLGEMAEELTRRGLQVPAVPVVSGDTSTAGETAHLWYLLTGIRSVHVEAGLRSLGPRIPEGWDALDKLTAQRQRHWRTFRDDPFPEGLETRIASVASQLWLAPIERNRRTLLDEGYPEDRIRVVGSLSSDAIALYASQMTSQSSLKRAWPDGGPWIRLDLHRRENTTPSRLLAVFDGMKRAHAAGHKLLLVLGRSVERALERWDLQDQVVQLRRLDIPVQRIWPQYGDVVRFLSSSDCLGIYTDSGGLQEECCVWGVPCLTCRASTDRPETVLEAQCNLLAPPVSGLFVARAIDEAVVEWSRPGSRMPCDLYGAEVGRRIANELATFDLWLPACGSTVLYQSTDLKEGRLL